MTNKEIAEIRGVNYDPCPSCGGLGTKLYGSTSTWRGGIGGAAMTTGVCNKCWGSGDDKYPWPSHREFEHLKKENQKLLGKIEDLGLIIQRIYRYAAKGKLDSITALYEKSKHLLPKRSPLRTKENS